MSSCRPVRGPGRRARMGGAAGTGAGGGRARCGWRRMWSSASGTGPVVTVRTVLPMAMPALRKPDGRIFLGLQRHGSPATSPATSRCRAGQRAGDRAGRLGHDPGGARRGPRLQDMLVDEALDMTMQPGFDFWLDEGGTDDPEVAASLERANASIYPTIRLAAARPATGPGTGEGARALGTRHEEDDTALDALARLARQQVTCCWAGPASPACSAPTDCWCRCGTSRARRPRRLGDAGGRPARSGTPTPSRSPRR